MPQIVGTILHLVNRLAIYDYRLAVYDDRISQAGCFARHVEATSLPVPSRLPLTGVCRKDEIMVVPDGVVFRVVTDHAQGFRAQFDEASTGRCFCYGNLCPTAFDCPIHIDAFIAQSGSADGEILLRPNASESTAR